MTILVGMTEETMEEGNDDPTALKDEWKECRQTIDRFDKLLVDLRKTGFSFITAIVSGATIFFSQGLSPEAVKALGQSPAVVASPDLIKDIAKAASSLPESAKFAIFTIIMVLTLMLYVIDLSHQRMLRAAVLRATELERRLGYEITDAISDEYKAVYAGMLGLAFYYILVIAIWAAFFLSVGSLFTVSSTSLQDPFQVAMLIEGGIALLAMGILSRRS